MPPRVRGRRCARLTKSPNPNPKLTQTLTPTLTLALVLTRCARCWWESIASNPNPNPNPNPDPDPSPSPHPNPNPSQVGEHRIFAACAVWVALGVAWGMLRQRWDVVT